MSNRIKFRLNKIGTEQFAIIDKFFDISNISEITKSFEFKFGADLAKRQIISRFLIEYLQFENPFLILEVSCTFKILDENWPEFEFENEINLPLELARHFIMLTIGTSRGVLHAKTENTVYNTLFLPTIDVTNLIKDEIKIPLKY